MTTRTNADQWAPVLLRLLLGAMFIAHGSQKVLLALHSPGLAPFARSVQAIGFFPGFFWAWVVVIVEFVGGICVFLGFATRIAAALIVIEMVIAGLKVNLARGFYWTKGGVEVPLIFLVIGIIIVLTGPGAPSVDHLVGWERGRDR